MINFIKFFLPGYVISCGVVFLIYKKVNIGKIIGDTLKRKILAFVIVFLLSFICLEIAQGFTASENYRTIISGIFMAPIIMLTTFVQPAHNKNK